MTSALFPELHSSPIHENLKSLKKRLCVVGERGHFGILFNSGLTNPLNILKPWKLYLVGIKRGIERCFIYHCANYLFLLIKMNIYWIGTSAPARKLFDLNVFCFITFPFYYLFQVTYIENYWFILLLL